MDRIELHTDDGVGLPYRADTFDLPEIDVGILFLATHGDVVSGAVRTFARDCLEDT